MIKTIIQVFYYFLIKDLNILSTYIIKSKTKVIHNQSFSEISSSEDESEKAKPKKDKEELRKYLKDSDEESSQEEFTPKNTYNSPKKQKKVKRLKTPSN